MMNVNAVNPIHKQCNIFVVQSDGRRKKIMCDKGIVDLVRELWKNGFKTIASCEGDIDKNAYVTVSNAKNDIDKCLRIIRLFWQCEIVIAEFSHDNHCAFYQNKTLSKFEPFEYLLNNGSMHQVTYKFVKSQA